MSLEDVFLELTDDSGKAARKLKKAEKEQLKQKEREKECEPEADKTAVGETSEEKAQMQRNQPLKQNRRRETHNDGDL